MKHNIWLGLGAKKFRKQNEAKNKGQRISAEIWGLSYLGGSNFIMWSEGGDLPQKLLRSLHIRDSRKKITQITKIYSSGEQKLSEQPK